jgi:hypothetical protein
VAGLPVPGTIEDASGGGRVRDRLLDAATRRRDDDLPGLLKLPVSPGNLARLIPFAKDAAVHMQGVVFLGYCVHFDRMCR